MHVNVTGRRLAEGESAELQSRFSDLLMNMELASVMLDNEGRITFCNDHLLRITGWKREEVVGQDWFAQFIPAADVSLRSDFRRLLASDNGNQSSTDLGKYENLILTRAGAPRLMRWSNSLQRSASGQVIGTASIGEDITEQRKADVQIRHLSRVRMVLGGINTLIVRVVDRESLYRGACRIAVESGGFLMAMLVVVDPISGGMRAAATAGKDDGLVSEINRLLATPELAARSLTAQAMRERQVVVSNDCLTDSRLTHSDDYRRRGARSLAVFPLLVAEQAVGTFVLYSSELAFFGADELALIAELTNDIAFAMDHIEKSERLAYLAFYDPLTGLPNAQLFQDQLDRYISSARQEGGQVSVVVLDLDGFTEVNRIHGRQVGDALLRAVAARLQHDLSEPFALARTAADTFAVACPSPTMLAANRVRDGALGALQQDFKVAGESIQISGKAGIAMFPDDGEDARAVIQNAESALKRAKASKQDYIYSSSALNAIAATRLALEGELRVALVDQQFRVYLQPRVDMADGKVLGAEALIRWQHPTRGLLAPGEFIELAEEAGLIIPIGAWMLQAVCAQQGAWIAAGLPVVPVAVNVSAVQFERGDLLQVIRDALQVSGLDPRLLHVELTESAVMRDPDAAVAALRAVRALGVELALDDFGTGYSSLASLKRYPFSAVKIDRSFVTQITSKPEDAAIATAIIAMAHGLQLRVVAEGVETQGQFNYLRSKNCDEMQGYLFSRPVDADAFEQILRLGSRLPMPDVAGERQPTLLLVDDEGGIRSALTRSLRQDGYRILSAASGEDALELLALHAVQVIISDQRMPGMSGTEFLATVARLHPTTVRILLSGYTDLKVVTEGVNTGAVFQFITKPWDDDTLRQRVRDAFRRQRMESES
jgi:diguanylate cyclase (GGDEF)-like protein/PAS domain S-box-containing protein